MPPLTCAFQVICCGGSAGVPGGSVEDEPLAAPEFEAAAPPVVEPPESPASHRVALPFETLRCANPLLDPASEESFDLELMFVEHVGLAATAMLAIRRGAKGRLKGCVEKLGANPPLLYRDFVDALVRLRFPQSRYWWKVELWLLSAAGHNHPRGKPPLAAREAVTMQKRMMRIRRRLAARWGRPQIFETTVFIPSFLAKLELEEAERIIAKPDFVSTSLEHIFADLLAHADSPADAGSAVCSTAELADSPRALTAADQRAVDSPAQ